MDGRHARVEQERLDDGAVKIVDRLHCSNGQGAAVTPSRAYDGCNGKSV